MPDHKAPDKECDCWMCELTDEDMPQVIGIVYTLRASTPLDNEGVLALAGQVHRSIQVAKSTHITNPNCIRTDGTDEGRSMIIAKTLVAARMMTEERSNTDEQTTTTTYDPRQATTVN